MSTYPEPITILELAEITRKIIIECTDGKINPEIKVVDNGRPVMFDENDKNQIRVNMDKARSFRPSRTAQPRGNIERNDKAKNSYHVFSLQILA